VKCRDSPDFIIESHSIFQPFQGVGVSNPILLEKTVLKFRLYYYQTIGKIMKEVRTGFIRIDD